MPSARHRVIQLFVVVGAFAAIAVPSAGAQYAAGARAHAASDGCPNADELPSRLSAAEAQAATLCLMNAQRAARGLPNLRAQTALARAATGFAKQMAEERFFDHTSPSGSTLLSRVKSTSYLRGTANWRLAENIARATGRLSTPRATVQAWMRSAPHRSNLLTSEFAEVGVGIASSGGGNAEADPRGRGTTYVADFGKRVLRAQIAQQRR